MKLSGSFFRPNSEKKLAKNPKYRLADFAKEFALSVIDLQGYLRASAQYGGKENKPPCPFVTGRRSFHYYDAAEMRAWWKSYSAFLNSLGADK